MSGVLSCHARSTRPVVVTAYYAAAFDSHSIQAICKWGWLLLANDVLVVVTSEQFTDDRGSVPLVDRMSSGLTRVINLSKGELMASADFFPLVDKQLQLPAVQASVTHCCCAICVSEILIQCCSQRAMVLTV